MPREQITHNRIISEHPVDDTGTPTALMHREIPRRNLHISWHNSDAGWVQVGIDVTLAELRGMLATAEDEAKAEARRVEPIGDLDIDNWQYRIVSDVLERHELNSAIKTLRRARDAAYGADA